MNSTQITKINKNVISKTNRNRIVFPSFYKYITNAFISGAAYITRLQLVEHSLHAPCLQLQRNPGPSVNMGSNPIDALIVDQMPFARSTENVWMHAVHVPTPSISANMGDKSTHVAIVAALLFALTTRVGRNVRHAEEPVFVCMANNIPNA